MDTLVNRIGELAVKQPEKLAVAFKTEQLTYGQLFAKAVQVSEQLKKFGIEKGDRVSFTAVSKPEMWRNCSFP